MSSCNDYRFPFDILKTATIMKLQAKTQEQKDYIKSLVIEESCDGDVSVWDDEVSYKVDSCFDVDISFDTMAEIVDYLRQPQDKQKDLFEECWVAYRRKGVKKKSLGFWNKLTEDERGRVLQHIKYYVSTRDISYQKDFERYLRDKIFDTIVTQGNNVVYDPTKFDNNVYSPQGRTIWFNEETRSYWTTDPFYDGLISDGYNDENRPDGATLTLNNARGDIRWSSTDRKWNKE